MALKEREYAMQRNAQVLWTGFFEGREHVEDARKHAYGDRLRTRGIRVTALLTLVSYLDTYRDESRPRKDIAG